MLGYGRLFRRQFLFAPFIFTVASAIRNSDKVEKSEGTLVTLSIRLLIRRLRGSPGFPYLIPLPPPEPFSQPQEAKGRKFRAVVVLIQQAAKSRNHHQFLPVRLLDAFLKHTLSA
jgi:hypothetical protein